MAINKTCPRCNCSDVRFSYITNTINAAGQMATALALAPLHLGSFGLLGKALEKTAKKGGGAIAGTIHGKYVCRRCKHTWDVKDINELM